MLYETGHIEFRSRKEKTRPPLPGIGVSNFAQLEEKERKIPPIRNKSKNRRSETMGDESNQSIKNLKKINEIYHDKYKQITKEVVELSREKTSNDKNVDTVK
jgi:hypothetical protein